MLSIVKQRLVKVPLKFGQNRMSKSQDIADIEFPVVGGGGWWCKVIFMSDPTKVMLG